MSPAGYTDDQRMILQVRELKKYFPVRSGIFSRMKGWLHAVDDVSFEIHDREIFGLVGESGCGKTTTGRLVLRLLEPSAGTVSFMGKNLFEASDAELRELRRKMQIIFQDPYASLNPRRRIHQILGDPLVVHGVMGRKDVLKEVHTLLETVGLTPPEKFIDRYPHELSGGQRQRIAIARAIASKPKFVVADEPVTALDVSIRAQIINLLKELKKSYGLTYLYITHDLAMARSITDRVGVMYLGKVVELAKTDDLFDEPLNPYSQALLSATPVANPKRARLRRGDKIRIKGEPPSPMNPPSGCRLRTRCPLAKEICAQEQPELVEVRENHYVACHHLKRH